MSVEFGLVLPEGKAWQEDVEAFLPELAGHFKSLWMTDHFFWDDNPTYEAWTTIAYMAARWPQFKIGPMVLGQGYRNPALLAKMAATLQSLTQGRFIMALGAGWKEDEYRAYGYGYPSPKVRLEQLEDALEIITRLWREPGKVSYQGKHYSIQDAWCEPKPNPVPPLIVGGGGKKTMLLAAKHADWWNLHDANIVDYSAKVKILYDHCAAIGRDPASLRLSWFGRLVVHQSEAEALALSDGKWTKDNAFVGTPDQVRAQLREFIDLGADYFSVEILGAENPQIRELLLNEVIKPMSNL
jgi:alkanesulfonate monooxygenase SsuD/methylene tetrahydromethanopterin reductase-like flavin-dependent oxidoreductase (luciferase family)